MKLAVPWNRGGLRTYLLVSALVFCQPGHSRLIWGLPLLLLGVALHVYAKGCLRQDQEVAVGGPYRFVRHPFYSANLLIDEGIALMSGWWPLILLLPVWWLLVYLPVMSQEERHLSELFPSVYPEYMARTPRLVPLRRPLASTGRAFSLRNPNIAADTVIPRAIRLLALPFLFVLCRELKAHGFGSFASGYRAEVWAAAALLVAYAASWQLARHLKYGKRILPDGVRTKE